MGRLGGKGDGMKKKKKHIDRDDSKVIAQGKERWWGWRAVEEDKGGIHGGAKRLAFGW